MNLEKPGKRGNMALFLQAKGNSGEISNIFLKSGKTQGNFFWPPIFLNVFLLMRSGEDTQKWASLDRARGSNWSKICGGPLWMMVNTFLGEELKEKSIYLLLNSGKMKWLFEWKMETQGKCFELFCLNPS